ALAGALVLLAIGCGSTTDSTSTASSQVPDAAVSAPGQTSPSPASASTEAEVVVDGAGFALGDYRQVGYGLVLKNPSSMDASDVQVTVNLMDKSGAILETDNTRLSLIPAGDTFYFGGQIQVAKGDKPTKMEAFVDVGDSIAAEYRLPNVTHVKVIDQEYVGVTVRGQVKNDWEDGTMSAGARIGCVLFGDSDKVVGGGFGYLMAALPPGRTAAIRVSSGTYSTPANKVKRAEVSLENAFEQ
ncbi:MAG: hypothetical protein NTX16_06200, partial [Actinobacteria bacterium]|nr:hypothetical protein [Actinomycetota bacterium]